MKKFLLLVLVLLFNDKETYPEPKNNPKTIILNSEEAWVRCKSCRESANLDNLIQRKLMKDKNGLKSDDSFQYIYFCGENCQVKFNSYLSLKEIN